MITTEMPARGTPRSVPGWSSRKHVKIVIPAFLLTAMATFTVTPAAAAATMYANDNATASWEPPPCRGDKPGICPYYYLNRPGQPNTNSKDIGRSDRQSTTRESLIP